MVRLTSICIAIGGAIGLAIVLTVGLMLASAAVKAHMADSGWEYDSWCCNKNDCRRVDANEVTERPDGYHYKQWVKPYGEARVSGDSDYHICIYHGELRCLYAPIRATRL